MKRLLFLLVLLLPMYVSAQSDSLLVLKSDVMVDDAQVEAPAPLTWKDRREPFLAGFLSYMMPGLGQVYNKEYEKAFGIMAFMACNLVMSYQFAKVGEEETSSVLIGLGMSSVWMYSFFDAISTAKKINRFIDLSIGKNASLSLKPDFQFNRNPMLPGLTRPQPTLGLKMSISL
jgi:hypothetical protein